MASHPYISGAGSINQMIGFLRKNFPVTVTSETVKKFGIALKNESYLINVLQFLGLIDEKGKRTDAALETFTKHDESEFRQAFKSMINAAYSDLFALRGDEAWRMSKSHLIGYFRNTDKTSDIIGSRQAGVFIALRELAGQMTEQSHGVVNTAKKSISSKKTRVVSKQAEPVRQEARDQEPEQSLPSSNAKLQKTDMALTVRVEINLPSEGTQETYDAIFKSIKANLYP